MTDPELAAYIVIRAYSAGQISDDTARLALASIEAGTFVPANRPAFVQACNAIAAALQNRIAVTEPALLAQVQALAASVTPI